MRLQLCQRTKAFWQNENKRKRFVYINALIFTLYRNKIPLNYHIGGFFTLKDTIYYHAETLCRISSS